jgi:hypothetical protein
MRRGPSISWNGAFGHEEESPHLQFAKRDCNRRALGPSR